MDLSVETNCSFFNSKTDYMRRKWATREESGHRLVFNHFVANKYSESLYRECSWSKRSIGA